MSTAMPQSNADEVRRALAVLAEEHQVVELRALNVNAGRGYTRNEFGFYDNFDRLAKDALDCSSRYGADYMTLNPVDPVLLARCNNHCKKAKKGDGTSDTDILRRRWLPIDCDATRKAGIASTDAEHAAALARRDTIVAGLRARGWREPIEGDSGNGGHALYRIDLPTDDGDLVKRCLEALAAKYNDAAVKVDTSVFNPARIWRLYGTVNRKGDPMPDRPHRLAFIQSAPDPLHVVPTALLEALAAELPVEPSRPTAPAAGKTTDVAAFLAAHCQVLGGPTAYKDGQKWEIVCPWNPEHDRGETVVIQFGNGAVSVKCQHNSCQGKSWGDLYRMFTPAPQNRAYRPGVEPPSATDNRGDRTREQQAEPAATPDPWEPLQPLSTPDPAMPFPVKSLLAPVVMNMVQATADAYNAPVDYAAAGAVAALSGSSGSKRHLRLGGEIQASATIWGAVIGKSGSGKTEPVKRPVRPLRKHNETLLEDYKAQMEEHAQDMARYEAAPKGDRPDKPTMPTVSRIMVSDTTIESVALDLENNPNGLLLFRDELSAFLCGFGRYSAGKGEGERAQWVEVWSHTPLDVSRKTSDRRVMYVPSPHIAIVGGIQPHKFHDAVGDSDDGLAPRFLLYFPDAGVADMPTARLEPEIEQAWGALIDRLIALSHEGEQASMELSKDARYLYRKLDHAFKARWPRDASPRLEEALAKLCQYAGRLTLVLMLACQESDFDVTDVECVRAAWKLIDYHGHCAKRAYGDAGTRHEGANKVIGWIERQRERIVNTENSTFKVSELADDLHRTMEQGDIDLALGALEDRHYIRLIPMSARPGKAGRKPTEEYQVNPAVLCRNNRNNRKNPDDEAPSTAGDVDLFDTSDTSDKDSREQFDDDDDWQEVTV